MKNSLLNSGHSFLRVQLAVLLVSATAKHHQFPIKSNPNSHGKGLGGFPCLSASAVCLLSAVSVTRHELQKNEIESEFE